MSPAVYGTHKIRWPRFRKFYVAVFFSLQRRQDECTRKVQECLLLNVPPLRAQAASGRPTTVMSWITANTARRSLTASLEAHRPRMDILGLGRTITVEKACSSAAAKATFRTVVTTSSITQCCSNRPACSGADDYKKSAFLKSSILVGMAPMNPARANYWNPSWRGYFPPTQEVLSTDGRH